MSSIMGEDDPVLGGGLMHAYNRLIQLLTQTLDHNVGDATPQIEVPVATVVGKSNK
jgi:hypothetical protein